MIPLVPPKSVLSCKFSGSVPPFARLGADSAAKIFASGLGGSGPYYGSGINFHRFLFRYLLPDSFSLQYNHNDFSTAFSELLSVVVILLCFPSSFLALEGYCLRDQLGKSSEECERLDCSHSGWFRSKGCVFSFERTWCRSYY